MRRSLGRLLIFWVILVHSAWGVTYQWHILKAPETLLVGQSGLVQYECVFDGSAAEYSVKLTFGDDQGYTAAMLSEHEKVVKGKRIQTFDVLITPKRSGALKVNAEAIVRFTTLEAIENTVLGRDNVGKDDIVETKTALPSITVQVDENTASLTGNMTLMAHTDRVSVRAHEPLHLSIFIRGSGNLDRYAPYELNISGVKVFAEPPRMSINPSPEGYEGEIRQEFALVAEQSYVIPPMSLRFFDTTDNRLKVLRTKPIHVEVGEGYQPSALLDPPDMSDMETYKRYALYLLFIVAGAGLSETVRRLWKFRPRRKAKWFWESVKTPKELVQILSLSGERRYDEVIRGLEEGSMSLSEAKKKLSTLTSEKEERRR